MIEEIGVVTQIDGDCVTVETEVKSTCGSCHAQTDCGTGVIARAFTPRKETIQIEYSDMPLVIGQKVKLGIPEEALLSASTLVYVLPMLILIISGALWHFALPAIGLTHELWTVAMTVLSTYVGFNLISKHLNRAEHEHYQPKIIGVLVSTPPEPQITSAQ